MFSLRQVLAHLFIAWRLLSMKLTMKRSRALSNRAPKSRYFMANSLLTSPAEPPPMSTITPGA